MEILDEYINLNTTDEDRRIINNMLYEGSPDHIAYRKNRRLAKRIKKDSLQDFLKTRGFTKIENYATLQCGSDNVYAHTHTHIR